MTTLALSSARAVMPWHISNRADPHGPKLEDRHYSRKTMGHPQFTPLGRCLVLLTRASGAFWVTSWPYPQYVKHAWAGDWLCSLFRNERVACSSDLILQTVAATRWVWGTPPALGFVMFVDPARVQSPNPGYCFKCVGFEQVGSTRSGLVVLQLLLQDMQPAVPAHGTRLALFTHEDREVTHGK